MLYINKSPTEEELIAGCRKGNPKAQKELYERLAPKMLGVCYRYIQDKEEAEYTMIGGFVKVFEKIGHYKGEGSFEGWVRRIMVNDSLMYLRKHKTMEVELDITSAQHVASSSNVEDLMRAEDLMSLIGELPIGYRTVFNLYVIEGYNHAEIAKMIGTSEQNSKSQLSRARKWLKERIETFETEEIRSHESREI